MTTPLLFAVSVFLTVYAFLPQVRLKKMLDSLRKTDKTSEISPVATWMIAISARVGVGTLAGTGLAIYIGGLGTIFCYILGVRWMLVCKPLLVVSKYAILFAKR